MKKIYTINIYEEVSGQLEVEAESREEAEKIALDKLEKDGITEEMFLSSEFTVCNRDFGALGD